MDWTEDSISLLRRLWDEGLSTAEIGRRMQVTKNAVVGKAHRLELPARPSPIRKLAEAAASPAATARIAPLPAAMPASATGGSATGQNETALDTGVVAVAAPAAVAAAPVPPPAAVVPLSPPAPEPRRSEPAASASPVSGTVHVLRPAMPVAPPRSAEPEAIPDPVLPRPAAPAPAPAAPSYASNGAAPRRRGMTCCWPLGEPGTREFHFCGADPVPGKPYCAEHAAMAYVKVRDRRDSVA